MTVDQPDHPTTGNSQLRLLIEATGLTYEALVRSITAIARENGDYLVRPNRSSVSHWLAGAVPALRTREYLVEALSRRVGRVLTGADLGFPAEDDDARLGLSLTADPVGALRNLATADLGRRSFLSQAAYSVLALASVISPVGTVPVGARLARTSRAVHDSGQRVGASDVQAVRDVTVALTALDERLGGQHGRDTVATWLAHDVTAMCRAGFSSEVVRRQMFSAAAEVAHLAGWKAYDAGWQSLAQRYYLQAYQLAGYAEGPGHSAYVLRIMAHHALDLNQPKHCIEVAEEAWRRSAGCNSQVRSLYAFTVSRAHAAAGDPQHAGAWLARAEALTDRDDDIPIPSWVSLGGSPQIRMASQAAKTLTAMGRHRDAEPLYARTASRWSPSTHPRVRALALNNLARAQVAQGHLDQACGTWIRAVEGLRSASESSARARRAVVELRASIDQPRHRTSRSVRELRALLDA
jgi:hypothetical protein